MASKARRRDRLSILDMSIEDDSLLPGSGAASSCPVVLEDEDPPSEMREQGSREVKVDVAPVPPVRKIKKQHNLRKSLAWDKAFLTGEGVLDPDELPIPTRSSPKKLPELPTLEVKSSLHDESNTSNANKDSLRVRSFSERFDSRSKSLEISITQGPEECARDTSGLSSPVIPRCAPAKKAIESAIQKGTRLRLPSTFTADERKTIPRPLKPQKESNLGKRVTSVSRRVKDTLGRVLPDVFTAERSSAVRLSSDVSVTSEGEPSCSLQSCSVSDAHDNISNSFLEDSDTGCDSSLKKDQTKTKALPSDDSRSKPTGLKMPSPKLGFFDAGRPTHQYATRAAVRIATGMPSSKTKPHGLPKGKPPTASVSSAIPSAPHLRKVIPGEQENLKKKEHTDENSESSLKNGPVPSATKSPLGVNGGLLNSGPNVAKERSSFFAFAKKAVGRLASPIQEKSSSHEKKKIWIATSCDGVPTESSATTRIEALKEDGNILKSGPVQHSPPNKEEPQPGPWSPVRKNGTQLGPFDCTKSNAQMAWD